MKPIRRILLLEAEPWLRRMLTITLGAQGYGVMAGSSAEVGETMLGVMGWHWPDLVVCCVDLGGIPGARPGFAFHKRWRARFPVPPFLFMAAEADAETLAFARDGDCRVCHILKPFAPADLLLLARAILEN